MEIDIVLTDKPDPDAHETILNRLVRFNIEQAGPNGGCIGAWLDTFSYQAPGFYEQLGYTLFGITEDYPPGHDRRFFQKRLVPAG